MKSEPDSDRTPAALSADARPYVGRFVRRQGNYGTILVVGRGGTRIDILTNAKRLFPRNGMVETQGVAHAGLSPGDWTEFDVVRNPRPRAPEYKTAHLRRLPRYAALPEATAAAYRVLFTKTGWDGDRRGGLWALRISGKRVIVVELAPGADGRLRIPRKASREVRWYNYSADLVVSVPCESGKEDLFLGDAGALAGSFDWSDEADHVAQVIRSLSDPNDPRVADIITWLELHHEEGTGRVFAAAVDHDAAEAALRSGELAERLKSDRDLMTAYLDAALRDGQVRDAVAAWAREGHGEEAERLREQLKVEMERERQAGLSRIAAEVEAKRSEVFEKVETEAAHRAEACRAEFDAQLRGAERGHAERLRALEADFGRRGEELEREAAQLTSGLDAIRAETDTARSRLDEVKSDEAEAQGRLASVRAEVDRLLAIAGRLDADGRHGAAMHMTGAGVGHVFHDRPQVTAAKKGILIAHHVLLTEHGRQLMRQMAALMLAGELPVLTGPDAQGLLVVAEALLCPGRSASIEADPTIISVDDLWSRPGSGAPTALAAAAKAAEGGGATLVTIRGIERSAARIWHPALAHALRSGALSHGLLVACVTAEPEHEEVEALRGDVLVIEVEGALTDSAYLAGPALLSPSVLELETLASGENPTDLSAANALLATLGFTLSLDLGLRIARMYVEGAALLGDELEARNMVDGIARRMAEGAGLRAS